jgi:hypothetical protein
MIFELAQLGRVHGNLRRFGDDALAAKARLSAIPNRDPQTNLVDPGSERRAAFERIELAVNDEQDFLAGVVHVGGRDAAVTEHPPDLLTIVVEDLADRGRGRHLIVAGLAEFS